LGWQLESGGEYQQTIMVHIDGIFIVLCAGSGRFNCPFGSMVMRVVMMVVMV
jgi:hypothetical protein